MHLRRFAVCAGWLLTAALLTAQTPASPQSTFDAVAIHTSAPDAKPHVEVRGGRFMAQGITVWDLVKLAYPVVDRVRNDDQLAGGAPWVRTARFDIVATGGPTDVATVPGAVAPPETGGLATARLMLQAMLADRFALVVHTERRELPAYALTRRSADRLGSSLRVAAACEPTDAPDARGAGCGGFGLVGPGISGRRITMSMLASLLSNLPAVGRIVEDRTGLSGEFDLSLDYSPPAPFPADAGVGPSIFTALQEQLGLALEPTRRAMAVIVIDRVSQPTGN